MKTIDISKASRPLSDYARDQNAQPLVITRKGKPLLALVSVEGLDLETIRVGSDPKFKRIVEKSRESVRKEGTISEDEMRRRLGIPPRRTRR